MRCKLVISLAFVLLALPVAAKETTSAPPPEVGTVPDPAWELLSGEAYLAMPDYDRQVYVGGLNDAYLWSFTGGFERMRWLVPCVDERSARQLSAMFTKWLEANPERWHEPAAKLFPFAIFEFCRERE